MVRAPFLPARGGKAKAFGIARIHFQDARFPIRTPDLKGQHVRVPIERDLGPTVSGLRHLINALDGIVCSINREEVILQVRPANNPVKVQ